jgi:beta-lactamase class A
LAGALIASSPGRSLAAPVDARDEPALDLVPDGSAGVQLAWVLDQINGGASALDAVQLDERFTSAFLEALPAENLLQIFQTYFAPNGPMQIARFEGAPRDDYIKAILITPGRDWRVTIGVDPADDARINQLFFEPVFIPAPLPQPLTDWPSLKHALARIAPLDSFLAAEIDGDRLQWLYSLNGNQSLGVGSSFKLYVLGELARQIQAGSLAWDEPLAVSDDLRSLPNGDMRLEPAGASFSLLQFAEAMISHSDNTATDHLIARLGRENVEAAFAAFGNSQPERNIPLLMTREWFALKLRLTPAEIDRYLAFPTAEKRAFLAETVDSVAKTLTEEEDWPGSYYIEQIEWFASAADLCRAMASLHRQALYEALAPIHDTLSINPGIAFDARTWSYVGYKGGYETGVKSDVWLLQRRDGRWFVLAAIINDQTKEIDGIGLWQHIMPVVDLLARVE